MAGSATYYAVNDVQAVTKWSKDLMKESLKRTSALQYISKGSDNIVQLRTEFNAGAATALKIGLRMQLSGEGIVGDATLEGNEEPLTLYQDTMYVDQLRHAVRSGGRMSEQRVPFTVRDEALDGLADWWAARYDQSFFRQLCGDNYTSSADNYAYTGMNAAIDYISLSDTAHISWPASASAHTEAALASDSAAVVLTLAHIDAAVEKAKTISPVVRPIRMMGEDYWVFFAPPSVMTDLRTSTTTGQWLDIQKAAMQGADVTRNPIFTGAMGVYNGVILKETTYVRPGNVTPTTGKVYRNILCGAQAAALAYGMGYGPNQFSWVEKLFDFENQLGVAAGCIWGLKLLRYNSANHSVIAVPSWTA